MRNKLVSFAAAATLAGFLPMASATVLDFDALKGSPTDMPESFGGLDWFGWQYYSVDQGNQIYYAPASGETRLLTSFGDSNSISSANAFTFQGAYFGGNDTAPLSYLLKLQGNVVFSSATFKVSLDGAFVNSGYDGAVDQVVILNSAQQRFVMDDVTFNETSVSSPVPEIATWPLMSLGLAALALLRRRRARPEA